MRIQINFDDDIRVDLNATLDVESEWFVNLPVAVQLSMLAPYVQRQSERDEARLGFSLKEAA